jgi:hypothetical protein
MVHLELRWLGLAEHPQGTSGYKITQSLLLSRLAALHHALDGVVDVIEDVGASQQTGFTVF